MKSLLVKQTTENGRSLVRFEFPYYAEAGCPTMSPNKRRIGFLFEPSKPTRQGGGLPVWNFRYLVLYDPELRKRITVDASPHRWYWCRLSPDGKQALAIRQREGQTFDHMTEQDVMVIDCVTGKMKKVSNGVRQSYDWFDSATLFNYIKVKQGMRMQTVESRKLPPTTLKIPFLWATCKRPDSDWVPATGAMEQPAAEAVFLNLKSKQVWATGIRVAHGVDSYLSIAQSSNGFAAIGEGAQGSGLYLWRQLGAKPTFLEISRNEFLITSWNANGLMALTEKLPLGLVKRYVIDTKKNVVRSTIEYPNTFRYAIWTF